MEPHRHVLVLDVDAVTAFEAFTARISEWWPEAFTPDPGAFDGVHIEPRVGGQVVMAMSNGDEHVVGEVTAWDPGTTYGQTWTLGQDPDHPSSLTVRFTDTGDGSEVVFEHGGWHERNADHHEKFVEWPLVLERYAFVSST